PTYSAGEPGARSGRTWSGRTYGAPESRSYRRRRSPGAPRPLVRPRRHRPGRSGANNDRDPPPCPQSHRRQGAPWRDRASVPGAAPGPARFAPAAPRAPGRGAWPLGADRRGPDRRRRAAGGAAARPRLGLVPEVPGCERVQEGGVMAEREDIVEKPQDWDKAVSVAYLRLLGAPIRTAAKVAGVGERTLHRWERSPWWPDATAEANDRWFKNVTAAARRTLLKAIRAGRSDHALQILERVEPRLAPPKQRMEHSGPDGAPIAAEVRVTLVRPDGGED